VLSPQKDHHGITYPLGIIKEKEQKEACDCVLHNLAVMQSVSNMTFQHPSPVGLSSVLNITGPQPFSAYAAWYSSPAAPRHLFRFMIM
jgi:hypothetical protein